jgi:hypothetical protein
VTPLQTNIECIELALECNRLKNPETILLIKKKAEKIKAKIKTRRFGVFKNSFLVASLSLNLNDFLI